MKYFDGKSGRDRVLKYHMHKYMYGIVQSFALIYFVSNVCTWKRNAIMLYTLLVHIVWYVEHVGYGTTTGVSLNLTVMRPPWWSKRK